MRARLATPWGSIEIDLNDSETPLACRCLLQQVLRKSWATAEFTDGEGFMKLSGSRLAPVIAREGRNRELLPGNAAYGETTAELIFCTGNRPIEVEGTVLGEISEKSLKLLKAAKERVPQSNQLKQVLDFEKRLQELRNNDLKDLY